ncbi:uncharacterized protein N7500_003670 [Penicillium coprophilum]|uniref:uncharacterized protein n=1 Tax=Penicillium coprophilum TaxID=36646 RepID=UPI002387D044|nr:uncharacterized protein N7500_003670 [Penicillium coprophilum]KAJ5170887.1 hypothetical protein N7500_003670 [Penicillium coprophilum]
MYVCDLLAAMSLIKSPQVSSQYRVGTLLLIDPASPCNGEHKTKDIALSSASRPQWLQPSIKGGRIVKKHKYESPIKPATSKPSAEKLEHVSPRNLAAGNLISVYDVLAVPPEKSSIMH